MKCNWQFWRTEMDSCFKLGTQNLERRKKWHNTNSADILHLHTIEEIHRNRFSNAYHEWMHVNYCVVGERVRVKIVKYSNLLVWYKFEWFRFFYYLLHCILNLRIYVKWATEKDCRWIDNSALLNSKFHGNESCQFVDYFWRKPNKMCRNRGKISRMGINWAQ